MRDGAIVQNEHYFKGEIERLTQLLLQGIDAGQRVSYQKQLDSAKAHLAELVAAAK